MNQPLVSVVIPFYSGQRWLKEAIDSVLNQSYENKEILVINDGSNEDISDLMKSYNCCVNFVYKQNGGPASARNIGIEKSSGDYIAFLDSDDIWLQDKLTDQISAMEVNNYHWSHHSYEMFWEGKEKTKLIDTSIYSGNVYKDCFISFKVQTSCVVVKRNILFKDNIRFPIEKRYGQDTDFYKQIAEKYPIGYINGIYTRFRIRGSNAGFRAFVQINDKASTWKEIKENKSVLSILPRPVIFAYKVSTLLSKWINFLNKKDKMVEIHSKILYSLPYSIFKFYSRKN
ncbi:glycosyltransferase family 2 protein [Sutcliffiella horikoshii]|uniref:glycosyltransferase family 2 protein n=1 Tax=Sutcliffiella horikoshii TaxID=79883 RepID=UPI001CBA97C7|nr:glycosyltransferase family A protein [Sutcliffiella horikoshii]UAL47160.1 glycosyltransferase family 2 protein [Sutcliffiella horikoshii]